MPGDQAVVPVRFDKLTPAQDFLVAPLPEGLAVVDAAPGRCEARVMEMSVCIENTSVVDVTLERGDVVAAVVPEGDPGALVAGSEDLGKDDSGKEPKPVEAQGEGVSEGAHGQARSGPREKRRRARKTERKEVVAATAQVGAAPVSEAAPRWRSLVIALLMAGVATTRG